jgi:hypothetical protein
MTQGGAVQRQQLIGIDFASDHWFTARCGIKAGIEKLDHGRKHDELVPFLTLGETPVTVWVNPHLVRAVKEVILLEEDS